MMTFTPTHHFLHIEKVLLKDLVTEGGIHLPDNLTAKAAAFKVLACGPGFYDPQAGKRVPMSVKVGDYVLINVNELVNASYAGRECLICAETSVFGIVAFDDLKEIAKP